MNEPLPQFDDFAAAAQEADVVALCIPLAFDHETAVTLADRFVGEDHFFLLESATSGPNARHSFLGFDPLWSHSYEHGKGGEDPIQQLRDQMAGHRVRSVYPPGTRLGGPDVAAMGGAAGFFSYDVARALEPSVGTPPPKTLGLPDAFHFVPRNFLVLDHLARRLFVTRHVLVPKADKPEALKTAFDAELGQLKALVKRLKAVHSPPPLVVDQAELDHSKMRAAFTQPEFEQRAKELLEDIKAGEIFQIQIGNRLSIETEARPFDIFRHLRMLNPSPYMFFYKMGEHHVLGASPEMMVGVQDDRMTHRPIAGTRRRTWQPAKDAAMREEIVTSEKERAEHVMLVDLSRNDIGRIAAPGSVKVEELMTVEEYSHVFHMVSQVTGRLAPGKDAYDALISSFPNGTVSGAPKIRAMQLIYKHEKISREFYAGSLGLFDFKGNLRSTILIRTIHVARGVASTQASAGIVYDSTPKDEWLETRNKMAACLIAMQNTR